MTALKFWDGSAWQAVGTVPGPPGPQGDPGMGWQGDWQSDLSYVPGDVVAYEGQMWVANQNTTGSAQYPGSVFDTWDLAVGRATSSDGAYFRPAGWCDTTALTASTWKTLPTKSGANPGGIFPAGSYIENADGSVTVAEAGVYTITCTAVLSAAGDKVLSVGSTPNAQNYWDHVNNVASSANEILHLGTTVKLDAGQKIYLTGYNTGGGNAAIYYMAIVRETGSKGDKGDPGGTMGAAVLVAASAGAGTTVTNSWKTVPFGSSPTIDPAGSFVDNGDGSFSVTEAGYYHITAQVHGAWPTTAILAASISRTPNVEGGISAQTSGTASGGPRVEVSGTLWCAVADKNYITAWSSASQGCVLDFLSAVRQGGPKGDKGDTGDSATASPIYGRWASPTTGSQPFTMPFGANRQQLSAEAQAYMIESGSAIQILKAGAYRINFATMSANSVAAGNTFYTRLKINGTDKEVRFLYASAASQNLVAEGFWEGELAVNDLIAIEISGGGLSPVADPTGVYNFLHVEYASPIAGPKGDPGDPQTPVEANHARYALSVTGTLNAWSTPMLPTKVNDSGDVGAFTVINPHPLTGGPAIVVRDYGVYHVTVQTTPPPTAYRHLHQLRANGSFMKQVDTGLTTTAAGVAPTGDSDFDLVMAAGTVLDVVSYTNLAGAVAGHFSITRLVQGQPGPRGDPGPPLPVGGATGESLVKASANPQDAQWAIPKGALIDVQKIIGANSAYKVMTSGQRFATVAAGTTDLALSYTPPVDVWWEVTFFLGILNKTDAAYHYAQPGLYINPADADGWQGPVGTKMQHSTVQTFEHQVIVGLFKLAANVAYQAYCACGFSGGTWQYHQGPQQLTLTAKAYKR